MHLVDFIVQQTLKKANWVPTVLKAEVVVDE